MNGTGPGTSREIKPLPSQNHIDSPSFLVQSQFLTLLALPSQPFVEPWTISNFWPSVSHRQKSISFSDILGRQKSIKVLVLAALSLQGTDGNFRVWMDEIRY